ncbi:site-specific integrase [Agrobacterium tumefaciens]|uniref:putative site specific integrase n=1 Tax=Agrobacterium tumefaciens TaxID=358 RepID=UPI000200B14E|nr:putative site specific integrase [Agrobacterium tumefaciens]ADY66040.1 putative site specific integrase [Agrobacterium tumefaciens]
MTHRHSAPTVKQRLAAVRHLFDWLVTGQAMASNPAYFVCGPKHSRKRGKTPALSAEEARQLPDSISTETLIGKRDRALIRLMTYTFARIDAATYSARTAGYGFDCTKKVAGWSSCPVIIRLKPSWTTL